YLESCNDETDRLGPYGVIRETRAATRRFVRTLMSRVTIAPANGNRARTINAPVKLFVRLRTTPLRQGPPHPPRFPLGLTNPIPAAAPVPVSIRDDIAQNGPRVPQMPTAATASAASSPGGALKNAAAARPSVPTIADAATCLGRSPRWSELLPIITIPT